MRKAVRFLTTFAIGTMCLLTLINYSWSQAGNNHHKKKTLLTEPATVVLLGAGIGGVWLLKKRGKK